MVDANSRSRHRSHPASKHLRNRYHWLLPLLLLAWSGPVRPSCAAEAIPAVADLASEPNSGPATRRALLQALVAAEPHRVRELLHAHGIDWCGMAAQTRNRNPLRLMGAGSCGIEGPADLPANRDACIPDATTPFKTIRLKFNVFRNSDGSAAAATQAQVDAQVNELNQAYAPARLRFVHTTEFVNSSAFRSLSYFVNSEEDAMKRAHADRPDQQHNIYVTDIEPDPERGGSLLGVSTFPWDAASTQAGGGTILDDDSIGAGQLTLVHELGHALGLWHTHHGVLEVNECSACYERADGSNANTTGDLCSDTPPTPVNYKCQAPGGTDPCSNRSWGATAPQNYMGYAPDSCYTQFTPQQAGRMHCWIRDRLQGWLVDEQGASVTVAATDPNAAEAGQDVGTFTVTRTGGTAASLTVNLTRAGTATAGADYLAIADTVVIAAGSASATVRVTPVNDTTPEPNETVILGLAAGAGYQVGNPASATVTIRDDDGTSLPSVTLAATDANAAEQGGDPARFTVTRTGTTTAALNVNYSVGGTANSPADYPALAGVVTIPAGNATAVIDVIPVDDTLQEPAETVVLTLTPGTGYTLGDPASATATIADNDAPPSSVLLAEGFDTVTPPAIPTGWVANTVGVGQPWQTFAFAGGSPPNIAFVLSVDDVGESLLTSPAFNVPASGARVSFLHGFNLEEGFDGAVLEISIAGGPFADLAAAGGIFEQGGYNGTISQTDGSAIAGRAAWTGSSVVNITSIARLPATASGQSVRLRWRLASDGGLSEEGWGLDDIEVASGSGGGESVIVTVTASDPDAAEAGTDRGEFTVTRTGSTAAPLNVNLAVNGTATPGADYTAIPTSVTLPAGSASTRIVVTPVDDASAEPAEAVVLNLVAGTGYAVGAPASATVTIADNDGGGGVVVFAETFDGVGAPRLPAGWAATQTGAGLPWQTVTFDGPTPPNIAFVLGPADSSDHALTSPPIAVATADARLTFEHGFILEDGYDGGVLEISIAGGNFVDIVAAGGAFVTGGYTGTISTTDGSAIAGRAAWTGDSVVNLVTAVRLPASAAGGNIRLRWRLVTDGGIDAGGWGIDSISLTESIAGNLPVVTVVADDSWAAELGPDTGGFTVRRTGATGDPLAVTYTVGGTATAGADYQALAGSVTIPAGSSTATLPVAAVADGAIEGAETVSVQLGASPNYTLGSDSRAEVTLLDNGTAAPVVFAANFDDASPPALPPGWTVNLAGVGIPWSTVTDSPLTPPHFVFAPDPDGIADNTLTSPPIPISTTSAQLVFLHDYRLEGGYDGGVLEIALGADANTPFQDILAAGGRFVTGGYDGPLSTEDGSPIAGRSAWTGNSGGPKVTRVDLPATAAGKSIRLRWRCASDAGVADVGWAIDTVAVAETGGGTAGSADLAVSIQGTPSPVVTESRLTYTITVTNLTPVVASGVVVTSTLPANVRLVSATASQGTVTGTETLVAQLGLLSGRSSASLAVVVLAAAAGPANASVNVAGQGNDPVPANNVATLSTPVLPTSTPTFGFTNTAGINLGETAGPADTYPSTLTVTGFQGAAARVAVQLHALSHTFPDDLDLLLVGPGGRKVMLMSDAGGDERFAINHASLTFADDAAESLPDHSAIVTGVYRPTDFDAGENLPGPAPAGPYGTSLGVFNGIDPNGTWQLFVADDEAKDGGRIAGGWSLAITRAVANATPPTITADPQSQVIAGGSTATFTVAATGTAPLSYQWRFQGTDIPGATGDRLTLQQVTPERSGDYTVRVRNDAGSVLSRPATLTVTTRARQVRVAATTASAGASVVVPVTLAAQGDENRVRFSIAFDPERLSFTAVGLGGGAAGATLGINVNQLESGRFGVQLTLPAGRTFAAGATELALLNFDLLPKATDTLPIVFVDAPTAREITGIAGEPRPADFVPGSIVIGAGGNGPSLGVAIVDDTGRIRFPITGQAGKSILVETSTNLRTWTEAVVLSNPTGTVTYTDPNPVGGAGRFYRAAQLP